MDRLVAIFNILVGLILPLATLVTIIIKKRQFIWPFCAGMLTFFISQMVLRVPLMQLLNTQAWYTVFTMAQPVIFSLLIGLSAGVFEEVGRYGTMRLTMRKQQAWQAAIAFGLGHGFIEGILLIGINYSYLLALNLAYPVAAPLPDASMAIWAGIERLLSYVAHVGWSVMVMQAVRRKKLLWLLLAVITHGIVDGMLGIWQMLGWGTLAIEAYIAVCAILLLIYTVITIRKENLNSEKDVEAL